uniref:Uncharacterized protein n=1 Tax=Branchiostoma floridae TaxID=7739 RepID=C3YF37_BRAFL|eukprot:XP_002605029.1 hypothetical protein BRAFLDRAFT_85171 [Branchiostoma floridae]
MATETILTPGVEGLFQRKRSNAQILSDPRVLAHLQQLHDTAQANGHLLGQEDAPDRDHLPETIANYNRRNPMEAFKVVLINCNQTEHSLLLSAPRLVYNHHSAHLETQVRPFTPVLPVAPAYPGYLHAPYGPAGRGGHSVGVRVVKKGNERWQTSHPCP